jgi:hypothetical protein
MTCLCCILCLVCTQDSFLYLCIAGSLSASLFSPEDGDMHSPKTLSCFVTTYQPWTHKLNSSGSEQCAPQACAMAALNSFFFYSSVISVLCGSTYEKSAISSVFLQSFQLFTFFLMLSRTRMPHRSLLYISVLTPCQFLWDKIFTAQKRPCYNSGWGVQTCQLWTGTRFVNAQYFRYKFHTWSDWLSHICTRVEQIFWLL